MIFEFSGRDHDSHNQYGLKALLLPPAPLAIAGFLVAGLVAWQYSAVLILAGLLVFCCFGLVLLALSTD